jgi:hypothetical protein
VYQVTQGGDVTQITIVNMTQKTYQEWDGSLDEAWAAEQGITEFIDEEKEKLTEYIGLNTEYNFGPNAQTTTELFTEAGRAGEGIPQTRVFGSEDMTKWLELAYGQSMATLTYNGDF